jgi:uncharacterized membrane protein YbhN (UPF0104 family)
MWDSSNGKARAGSMGNAMQWFGRHPAAATVLKTAAAALLLAGVVWYVDLHALAASIRSARPDYLAAGVLLLVPNLGLQFLRWRFLLRTVRCDAGNASVFASLAAGFTAGFFTPAQLGEIGGRLFGLDARHRAPVLTMAALDKMYIFGTTVVLGLASAIIFFPAYHPSLWGAGAAALSFVIAAASAVVLVFPVLAKKILLLLPDRVRAHKWYAPAAIFEADFSSRSALIFSAQTLLFFGVIIAQYHCFVNAFAPAPFSASALCVPIVLFVKSVLLPISIGDLGVRESASVFFYQHVGVPAAAALNGSLCIFAVNVVLPAVAGIAMLMKSTKRK